MREAACPGEVTGLVGWRNPLAAAPSGLGVILPPGGGGAVHGVGLDTGLDLVAFKLAYFFSQISVGPLGNVIKVKCDIPNRDEEVHGELGVHDEDLPGVIQEKLA